MQTTIACRMYTPSIQDVGIGKGTNHGWPPISSRHQLVDTSQQKASFDMSAQDPNSLPTWNPNDPCFDWKRPCFEGFNHQNRGQTRSR